MSTLNWKDHAHRDGSQARASNAVGDRYRIIYRPAWRDEIVEPHYEIEYCRSHRREWDNIDVPYNAPTLIEAKRRAEEDHEQRRQEVLIDSTAEVDHAL
jgi:hypothetical protein